MLPVTGEATEVSEIGLNVNILLNNYVDLIPNAGTNEDLEIRLNLNPGAQPIDTRVHLVRFVPTCS